MQITTPEQLFERLLSFANSAEKQMTRNLPKLARASQNPELVKAFEHHLEETQAQLERIEQVADSIEGLRLKRIKDQVMASLIEDSDEIIEGTEPGPVRDAALIGAAQKVEHYEIAAYGTLCALAEQLGYLEAKDLLGETLEEEKSTDQKLTEVADLEVSPAT
jgi:ferritin-like metal-binding protein YciE